MLVKETAFRLISPPADVSVRAHFIGNQLSDGAGLSLEWDLSVGVELLIFRAEAVFLLHQGNNRRGEGFFCHLHIFEPDFAVLLFQFSAQGRVKKGVVQLVALFLKQRG